MLHVWVYGAGWLTIYETSFFGILGACPVEKVGDIYFSDVDDNDDNVLGDNVDERWPN